MAGLGSFNRKNNIITVPFLNIPEDTTARAQVLSDPKDFTYFVEHVSPVNWMRSAVCTWDSADGCWACEQQAREWNQRLRLYIPVLHDGAFKVLSQTLGKGSVLHSLVEHKIQSGTTWGTWFDITRSGKGKRTKYTAIPVEIEDDSVYNGVTGMKELLKSIDYSEQAKYYNSQ